MLAAGRRLTPRDVALAAAANHPTLPVRRRPRVAILATGDELVAPGAARGPAQIVASNNFAVAGIVVAAGGEPIDLGIAVDDPARAGAQPRGGAGGQGRRAGDARRRFGRRLRSRAEGAGRRRHGARLLAHRHAAGQTADPRPARRDARARPARQSHVLDGLRPSVPQAAAARAGRRPASRRRPQRARAPRCRPARQCGAPGLHARDPRARRRRRLSREPCGIAGFLAGQGARARRSADRACARRRRPRRARPAASFASRRSGRSAPHRLTASPLAPGARSPTRNMRRRRSP